MMAAGSLVQARDLLRDLDTCLALVERLKAQLRARDAEIAALRGRLADAIYERELARGRAPR